MINTKEFVDSLLNEGFDRFYGVPCSNLTYLINELVNRGLYYPCYNEGDAVAKATASTLSSHKPLVLIQNSGITNAMSPLTSLSYIYNVKIPMIVGHRGGATDEPQHSLMGEIDEQLLKLLGYNIYRTNEPLNELSSVLSQGSYALLVDNKSDFSPVKLTQVDDNNDNKPTRDEAIQSLIHEFPEDTIFVSSTGYNCRVLYDIHHSSHNFYMVGSMGCTSAFAKQIALDNPNVCVVAIDGDGSYLMRPDTDPHSPSNYHHIILDNGSHESTGGQYLGDGYSYKLKSLTFMDPNTNIIETSKSKYTNLVRVPKEKLVTYYNDLKNYISEKRGNS